MRTLPISIRRKILPLTAAATLTAGALTSCCDPIIDKNTITTSYGRSIEQLDSSLDSLKMCKNGRTINFQDYYTQSKEKILASSLDEKKLMEDGLNGEGKKIAKKGCDDNGFLLGIISYFLSGFVGLCTGMVKGTQKGLTTGVLTGVITGIIPIMDSYIELERKPKEELANEYVALAQKQFSEYKDQKLHDLNNEKNEFVKNNDGDTIYY